jgi:hypothetical protein
MSTKRVVTEKKHPSTRPRLVYEEPHVFRTKSDHSLSHLQENREFQPCIACLKSDRRKGTNDRPHSSYIRQQSTPPPSSSNEQRPSTATRNRSRLPPTTSAALERLCRPKTYHPKEVSNNCNWNNFIKKRSKYGMNKYLIS